MARDLSQIVKKLKQEIEAQEIKIPDLAERMNQSVESLEDC